MPSDDGRADPWVTNAQHVPDTATSPPPSKRKRTLSRPDSPVQSRPAYLTHGFQQPHSATPPATLPSLRRLVRPPVVFPDLSDTTLTAAPSSRPTSSTSGLNSNGPTSGEIARDPYAYPYDDEPLENEGITLTFDGQPAEQAMSTEEALDALDTLDLAEWQRRNLRPNETKKAEEEEARKAEKEKEKEDKDKEKKKAEKTTAPPTPHTTAAIKTAIRVGIAAARASLQASGVPAPSARRILSGICLQPGICVDKSQCTCFNDQGGAGPDSEEDRSG